MKRKLYSAFTAALLLILSFHQVEAGSEFRECVVLLHGLARTDRSLLNIEHHLENEGFCVVNMDYPSREKTIQDLSVDVIPAAIEHCRTLNTHKIHFVTHSMGGILVRYYLEHNKVPELGRVVMLSPPNSGSEIVDKFKDTPILEWINGPAVEQLGTGPGSLPKTLGAPYYEVGVITGDWSINPIGSILIPGSDDGTVSVENTKLRGMKDFLIVHESHPFIMNNENVIQQVSAFIKNGAFDRD